MLARSRDRPPRNVNEGGWAVDLMVEFVSRYMFIPFSPFGGISCWRWQVTHVDPGPGFYGVAGGGGGGRFAVARVSSESPES